METAMTKLSVRVRSNARPYPAELVASGAEARASFEAAADGPGVHLLLIGEKDYHVRLLAAAVATGLAGAVHKNVLVQFAGRKTSVRRILAGLSGQDPKDSPAAPALDLNESIHGAAPLWLLPDGTLAASATGPAPRDASALPVIVAAARWVSTRRTSSFECLFPASPFHPDAPVREEHLSPAQADALLDQLDAVLAAAAPTAGDAGLDAAQLRSAAATVLSHVVATVLKDPEFRAAADRAAARLFKIVDDETGDGARPDLRAHVINLLSMRGPALRKADQTRAQALLRGLRRSAPPYADGLQGPWRFVLNAGGEFLAGSLRILETRYGFTRADVPADAPASPNPWGGGYRVIKAPFTGPAGQDILVFGRSASPRDENHEMGLAYFTGLFINRHANLGAFDMKAALAPVTQVGYKIMFNAQCAGLTTRFAISRMFPDADIWSSWDSTYFTTAGDGELNTSEGVDGFMAVIQGMAAGEDFAAIDRRVRKAQWHHEQSRVPDFVQFIGPAHPLVVARYEDINRDGKADFYDGFLDLHIVEIAEAVHDSATPRAPGVAASQIGGAAASGLNWAAGSLNRATQYSELWDPLPGQSESFYVFRAAGFHSPEDPPRDVPTGEAPPTDLGLAPMVVRYSLIDGKLSAEVSCHAWLSHSAQELKRLLAAAEAWWRAIDLGYLGAAPLASPAERRAGLLLLLAGLLEFPADPNLLDGLWESALDMLQLPPLSRSLVRRCIDDRDHDNGNYYGSTRGIAALLGTADKPGAIKVASPDAHDAIVHGPAHVGRARPLVLPPPAPPAAPPAPPPAAATPPAPPSA
jgi:hypothetical protein